MNRVICDGCETVQHCLQSENGCEPKVPAKQVVYYEGVPQVWNWNNDPRYPVASLQYVFNHPRLGNCCNVRTSVIVNKYFDGTIETLNTIYKPIAQEPMGS